MFNPSHVILWVKTTFSGAMQCTVTYTHHFFRGVQKLEQGGVRAALMGAVQVETVEEKIVQKVGIVETVQSKQCNQSTAGRYS